jgi:hypothetical protein
MILEFKKTYHGNEISIYFKPLEHACDIIYASAILSYQIELELREWGIKSMTYICKDLTVEFEAVINIDELETYERGQLELDGWQCDDRHYFKTYKISLQTEMDLTNIATSDLELTFDNGTWRAELS